MYSSDPARARAREVAASGLGGRLDATTTDDLLQALRGDADVRVRGAALGALVRAAPKRVAGAAWRAATADGAPAVRKRAAEVAPALGAHASISRLIALLGDADAWVAETAAFALGEHPKPTARAIAALVRAATGHADPLVREAAVAALGAIGDATTRPVVLAVCDDKPAIRRRAVLALAAFDGDAVEARLQAALADPDWQVRQAAEDVLAAGK